MCREKLVHMHMTSRGARACTDPAHPTHDRTFKSLLTPLIKVMHAVAELGEHLPVPASPEELAKVQPQFAGLSTYCELTLRCLDADPDKRPSFGSIVSVLKPLQAQELREVQQRRGGAQ